MLAGCVMVAGGVQLPTYPIHKVARDFGVRAGHDGTVKVGIIKGGKQSLADGLGRTADLDCGLVGRQADLAGEFLISGRSVGGLEADDDYTTLDEAIREIIERGKGIDILLS